MKETNQQLPAQLLLRWLPNGKSSANIVTLCEDFGSAARAKDLCGQLAALLRPRTVIVDSLWSFDHLDHYDWYQFADSDVSGADILIVSVRGDKRLPAYAGNWLEILMRARNGKPGVMVALLGQERISQDGAVSVCSQLRHLADAARLDFFYSTNDTWNAHLNLSLAPYLAESVNLPMTDECAVNPSVLSGPAVIHTRGSEFEVKPSNGRLAESIDSEFVFETA